MIEMSIRLFIVCPILSNMDIEVEVVNCTVSNGVSTPSQKFNPTFIGNIHIKIS